MGNSKAHTIATITLLEFDFSRMRSKGSRFTLGVWWLKVCSLDVASGSATVRNRPQPFATVHNRLQPFTLFPYGRAYGKFCRRCHLWWFPRFCCFFSCGSCDIQTCFVMRRKLFCVAGAILLRRFSTMCCIRCIFHGRCSTLDVSIVIFRGRCSTLDVSC